MSSEHEKTPNAPGLHQHNDLDVLSELGRSMSTGDVNDIPSREQLLEAVKTSQAAQVVMEKAMEARQRASAATDPKEKKAAEEEANSLEAEAQKQGNAAKTLSSGALQGAGAGAGIGGAVGMGVGTVVGTLVGGITAVPTTGLGALIGSGYGAIKGPFVNVNNQGEGDSIQERMQAKVQGQVQGQVKGQVSDQMREQMGISGEDVQAATEGDAGAQKAIQAAKGASVEAPAQARGSEEA